MRLGYSAWAMPRLPVDEQIALVRRPATPASVSSPTGSLDAQRVDVAERRRIRRLLDDAGLALLSIAAHGDLLELDHRRGGKPVRVQAAIDLAADLAREEGPPCVVTMGYGRPEGYLAQREAIAEGFATLGRYAAHRGVVVALEPHVGQAFDLPERVAWLMERVGSPQVRLNLDNSHFEVMGCDLATYIPLLAPYAVHTHVKDQRGRSPQHQFLVPGEGDFDYSRYLREMARAGYQGFITVEISVMVQRRPDYDPRMTAGCAFATLAGAAAGAGVPLAHG